jgi:hypothetical protein
MAQTSATSPGTMADDATVGTVAWTNPDNAKVSDNVYATVVLDDSLLAAGGKLIKNSVVVGTEKTFVGLTDTEQYLSCGSSSDLWGTTWTAEDINSSDFGVAFRLADVSLVYSHRLKATNFGFSIPTGATINGIVVESEAKYVTVTGSVDHIRITIDYTEAQKSITGVSTIQGLQSITL